MSTVTSTRPPASPPSAPRPRGMPAPPAKAIDPFRIVRRHLVLLVATGLAGVALGVAAYLVLNRVYPLYSGEVLFEIRAGLDEARDIASEDITQEELVSRLASTESMLMTSRDVLMAAVRERDVQATRWFRENFLDESGVALVDEAVDELEEDVIRRLVQGTNLFGLAWSAHDAEDVPIVLNSIARAYLEERKRIDDAIINENLKVFSQELRDTNRQIDDLAQQIQSFIREKAITTLEDPRSSQLALAIDELLKKMQETANELNISRSGYARTAAKLEGTIEPSDDDRRMAEENPAARQHEMAMLQARTALRERREKYRDPEHFLIQQAERRLRAVEAEYEAKLDEIMTENLRAQLKMWDSQVNQFQTLLEELEQDYEEKEALARTLAADMAEYKTMEDQRDHLLARRDADIELVKEIRLMRLREDAKRVRLTQRALTPREKSFPKVQLVVPATAVLLLGLVTGLVFLRELTDQRIKAASDLLITPEARVLGVIPELDEDPCRSPAAELVVRRCPQSVLAESYRQACALIDKAMGRHGHRTLLVMGGLPAAGTTTVVTNLAATAAATGRSVAVVDANFRRPRLSEAMGVPADGLGLGDLLMDETVLEETLRRGEHGIHVIGAGRPENRIFERLNNGRLDEVLAQLRERFDLVFVDAPPAVVAGDALVLANKVDAAVLVVRAYQEQRGLVARLMNQLVDAHCQMLGIVLNRPRGTAGGYFKKNFAAMARYAPQNADGKTAG